MHFSQQGLQRCAFEYPLRLLQPQISDTKESASMDGFKVKKGALYVMTFGGSLVHGDAITLNIQIDPYALLSIYTQASTKIFGPSMFQPVSTYMNKSAGVVDRTRQHLNARLEPRSSLLMLPEPITPFARSRYTQFQRINMFAKSPSSLGTLVLLDWTTSGRRSRGETWAFDTYTSQNQVWINDRLVLRDRWDWTGGHAKMDALRERFHCVGALVLVAGSDLSVLDLVSTLWHKYQMEKVVRGANSTMEDVVWSMSPLDVMRSSVFPDDDKSVAVGEVRIGAVLRVASSDAYKVKAFLNENVLKHLTDLMGDNLFMRCL